MGPWHFISMPRTMLSSFWGGIPNEGANQGCVQQLF
jgi:hypothetical protein